MTTPSDGRTTRARMTAGLRHEGADQQLLSPGVGLVRGLPLAGTLMVEGSIVGELDVLGVLHVLVAPAGTRGSVEPTPLRLGERAVGHGDALVTLLPASLAEAGAGPADTTSSRDLGKLVFRSPLSGRYYARPGPDRPDFVRPGDEITTGQSVALLEVMKTFNRLTYGGPGLPERARVVAVLIRDEADVEIGAPILELEPV